MRDLKRDALHIFKTTLAAIDIPATMWKKLAPAASSIQVNGSSLNLDDFDRILTIAIGKASVPMSWGLTEILTPKYFLEGIVVTPADSAAAPEGLRLMIGGHPLPDEGSLAAARAILDLLATTDERTLIFFLLSGGGSALVEQPLDATSSLADLRQLSKALVTCGASIDEINSVRKHLSAVKGGRLACAAPNATKITLAVTDVPEGRESALASGPTLPDPTTIADACGVMHRYGLLEKLPPRFQFHFEHPETLLETPKATDPGFRRSAFQVLLGRVDLFHAAHRAAEAAGFIAMCDNTTDDWAIPRAADYLLARLYELRRANPKRPTAVIADGEVSSPVTGDGVGGRNSAFVLDCVAKIAGQSVAVLSVGTDGIDGSSPAAGAVADGSSLVRARDLGLDVGEFFRRSDSHNFFKQLSDAVETGPTGNNLRDLRILLAE